MEISSFRGAVATKLSRHHPRHRRWFRLPALARANIKVGPVEGVAVVGSVGSRKTALIKALLGELTPMPSTVVQQTEQAILPTRASGVAPRPRDEWNQI